MKHSSETMRQRYVNMMADELRPPTREEGYFKRVKHPTPGRPDTFEWVPRRKEQSK